jgi:hypothetical protein
MGLNNGDIPGLTQATIGGHGPTGKQDAEKVPQHKKIVVWFVWSVWFFWLNEPNQINKTNQINQTDRAGPRPAHHRNSRVLH